MIGLLQRVSHAEVHVDGDSVGAIGPGLLVLVGVQRGDTAAQAERLAERLVGYRVFDDDSGRMNRSLVDTSGGLLLAPETSAGCSCGHSIQTSMAYVPKRVAETASQGNSK